MSEQILDDHFTRSKDYPNADDYDEKLHGLKGWLAFLGISIVLSLLATVGINVKNYIPIIEQFNLYTRDQQIWISLEMIMLLLLIIYQLLITVFYFQKKKLFPKVFIGYVCYNLFFVVIDLFLIAAMLGAEPGILPLFKAITYAVIWTLYILQSLRVKHTFVF